MDDIPGSFELPEHADKWGHFVLFWSESWFLHRSLRHFGKGSRTDRFARWATCLLALGLAGLTEAVQSVLPTRAADVWDVAADAAGVLVWLTTALLWPWPKD